MYDEYVPIPAKSLRIDPLDSSYGRKGFIVQLGSGKRFEVNNLVASLINKIDGVRNIPAITFEFNSENNKNYSDTDVKKVIDTILRPKKMVVDDD